MCESLEQHYNPLTDRPTWIAILWKWASMLTQLTGDGECRLGSEIFLQIKFIIFQGCPTKQVAFLLG